MERDKLKKAIIFDCDNTLWEGVIGEGNVVANIDIFCDIILLANHGVIVGLCSKNNEGDLADILQEYEPYISVKRINWKDKVSNLKEIAEELNIGLDSIVFVDDSAFEIELVRSKLPDVLCIYPNELSSTVAKWFDLSGDFTKTQQYKANYLRKKEEEQFTNIDDYLASLDMVLTVKVNNFDQIPRISELTQKTNQFNLTTRRYTESDIKMFMTYDKVYSLSVRDKFGDNGLTGVCITNLDEIDIFLLSCRILGRGIEYAFLDKIVECRVNRGFRYLCGEYIATPKNSQVSDFYAKAGFELYEDNKYFIDVTKYKPKGASYFKYE